MYNDNTNVPLVIESVSKSGFFNYPLFVLNEVLRLIPLRSSAHSIVVEHRTIALVEVVNPLSKRGLIFVPCVVLDCQTLLLCFLALELYFFKCSLF